MWLEAKILVSETILTLGKVRRTKGNRRRNRKRSSMDKIKMGISPIEAKQTAKLLFLIW